MDQVAECTLLTGYTANLLHTRRWEEIHPRLLENARRVAAAIAAVPDSDLADEIALPWGKQSVAEMLAYPYWNLTYHLGQVNCIASLLGTLD